MKNFILVLCAVILSPISFGQSTWYEIPTGVSTKLTAIDFPTPSVGYIVGYDTTILKTIDGGQTWEQLGLNGISIVGLDDDFTDVDFIDANVGFVVCGYSGTYKTIDGGQNWTFISGQTSNMCFPHAIFPFTETNFFLAGGGCFEGAIIDHFTNNQWYYANLSLNFWNSNEVVVEMSFANLNIGLAATRSEYMLRTVDAGLNWDTIPTGISGFLTSVVMVNDTLCYAGYDQNGTGFGVLKSIDGGLTWSQETSSATFYYPAYLSVHAAQNGDVYSGAVPSNFPGGLIFEYSEITDWTFTIVGQPINDMTSYGSDITFGIGDSGHLVVNTPITNLGISEANGLDFGLYPNPVLNELTIENPGDEMMEVTVLDASGRLLKTDSFPSGSTKIDCSDLKNGMYFIRVKVNDRIGMKQFVKGR